MKILGPQNLKFFTLRLIYGLRIWLQIWHQNGIEFGLKPDFQECLGGGMKMAIAWSFLDQLTQFFFQMEAKAYIYVVQCHFEVELSILVPNLKCEVKISRF